MVGLCTGKGVVKQKREVQFPMGLSMLNLGLGCELGVLVIVGILVVG